MTDDKSHRLVLNETDFHKPAEVVEIVPDLSHRFGEAIRRHSHGEAIRYQISMFPLPTEQRTPQGESQIMGMLMLYVEIKGALLGTHISASRIMQPNGQTDEVIDAHVQETVEGLLVARSQQLQQQEMDAAAAKERGETPPVSGLINPSAGPNLTFDDLQRSMNGYARGE